MDGTSEWDGEKYGMTYIFGDLRDWYPTSGYRNRDKGNLAGLATTRTGHYWSNYRSGNTISCFYISKKLSTGKLLQPQSSSKSDAAYGYNVRCCRESSGAAESQSRSEIGLKSPERPGRSRRYRYSAARQADKNGVH